MARLEQMLEMVKKDRDVRENLIRIRQNISDESLRRNFMNQMEGDFSLFTSLLRHEDPKVRKNAALILGMTGDEEVLPALMEAWEQEETLFVREAYLRAASMMDYREYLPKLKERIAQLEEMQPEEASADRTGQEDPLWDNGKHLLAELSRLRSMTDRFEKHGRHRFIMRTPAPDLMLMTNRMYAEVTAGQIGTGTVNPMKGSVHVKGGDLDEIMKIRTWTELLFTIPGARPVAGDEKTIAQRLRDLKIGNYLKYLHEGSDQPFRYRIELKSVSIPREKKGEYIRRIASRLDALERGALLNTDSDYEVELRLIERKDKTLIPLLKLGTLPDRRFAYRKETTSQSTSPYLAALAVRLAQPYLREGAQILDPFCGSGTLLIERCLAVPADPVYGVDTFAEAVEKARKNAQITGRSPHAPIHFINRDFFDFTHDYLFDEIITELPKREDDAEAFAARFLGRASSLLSDGAAVIVLTDDPEAFRKALRDERGFVYVQEYLLNERAGTTEIILSKKC